MKIEKMKLTNRDLNGMFSSLSILGNRSMATARADVKVGRLLRSLSPTAEPLQAARQRIVVEAAADIDEDDKKASQKTAVELVDDLEAFDAEEIEVDVPTIRILQDDLPREKKGDDGWKNASQLGAIVSDLGVLFTDPPDEDDDDPDPKAPEKKST